MDTVLRAKVGRNAPCPCGSGKKFKKCCWSKRDGLAREYPVYLKDSGLPEIRDAADITAYCDAFVETFALFHLPRTEAILHAFRALQTRQHVQDAAAPASLSRHYGDLRMSQDLLRYLTYEMVTRCQEGGRLCRSSFQDLALAGRTADKFWDISRVRDAMGSTKLGAVVEVDINQHLVKFRLPPRAIADLAGNMKELRHRHTKIEKGQKALDRQGLRRSVEKLFATVEIDKKNAAFSHSGDPEVIGAFFQASEAQSEFMLHGEPLPGQWSLGPYTLAEFRRFWSYLQAIVSMNSLCFMEVVSGGNCIPHNSAVLIIESGRLVDGARLYGGLSEIAAKEIARDLTYAPADVPWTDITYQPLVKIGEAQYALLPLVIGASNYERNLWALVDRLPWRRRAAGDLKNLREGLMLDMIGPKLRSFGLQTENRILLGSKRRRLTDIDLLAWDTDSSSALAISLKWFYGGDSVQEVYNHSIQYREGIRKHRAAVEYLRQNAEDVSLRFRLSPPLTRKTVIHPLLVTAHDELLQRDRCADIPSVPLRKFISFIERAEGDLGVAVEVIRERLRAAEDDAIEIAEVDLNLGRYRFLIPAARGAR